MNASRWTPLAAVVLLAGCDIGAAGQEIKKSQHGEVLQTVAGTEIAVVYNRPVARGRTLFGPDGIVSYDEVWNPGADQATRIELSNDVVVNGQPLPAGSYSIWAIPRADRWTVIFNRAADVFHVPYPGEETDALRLDVTPETGSHMETLAFYFPVVDGREAVLRLHWGATIIPLAIRVPDR